jgi:hypothetical protein
MTTSRTNVRAPVVDLAREDERGIHQVLQQYERAYEWDDASARLGLTFPSS